MPQSILVTGATGRLGRLVVKRLIDLGQPVRAFTRRPEIALSLFGEKIEVVATEGNNSPPKFIWGAAIATHDSVWGQVGRLFNVNLCVQACQTSSTIGR